MKLHKLIAFVPISFGFLISQAPATTIPPYSRSVTIDVYAGVIPSSEIALKQLWMMVQALQSGAPATLLPNVIHIEKTVEAAFDVTKEAKTADGQEIDLAAHVETDQESGKIKIVFSGLGRPSAYEGATALLIGPNEHRVLRLPVVQEGDGEQKETIVAISTAPEKTDKDGHSRFEVGGI